MIQLLYFIFKNWKISVIIVNLVIVLSLYNKNGSLLKEKNEFKNKIISLEHEIKNISINRENISKISKKQNDIAYYTDVNIKSIHEWMLELSSDNKQ